MPSGSYAERIRSARPNLSKSFQRLADYILDSYVQAALMTASELAHEVDVDAATVVRFAQALDYSGFPDLQDEIKARVLQDMLIHQKEAAEADTLAGVTDRTFKELGDAVERARRLMDPTPLQALLKALGQAKRVLVLADAFAQSGAEELMRHMQSVGITGHRLATEEGTLARSLASATDGDLLLVLDLFGKTPLISSALAQAQTLGLGRAAIVGGASFDSARRADIILEVQPQEQSDAGTVVLGALVHALGSALRWRYPERFKENQAKTEKLLRKLSAPRTGRSN
ncbi:MAG: MurR/RpiR family transcriptional regulator [Chloroflexi bacterium]|nr:MurR/RpiR family transcriptional regulator [Chloroflexota bacterium]